MRTYTIPLFGLLALMVLQTGGLWMGIKSLQVMRVLQQEIRVKSNPCLFPIEYLSLLYHHRNIP